MIISLSLSLSLSPPSLCIQNLLNEKGATYVFNHVHLLISYHKATQQKRFTDGRIVHAQVQLASCKKFPCTAKSGPLKLSKPEDIDKDKPFELTYSYTVEFIVSLGSFMAIACRLSICPEADFLCNIYISIILYIPYFL